MLAIFIAIILLGIVMVVWLYVIHKAIFHLRSDLVRERQKISAPKRAHNKIGDESAADCIEPIPRQIVHDLNNLLGTMGGFAEAALEDLNADDPIGKDLKEISDAAERAKSVVKRLDHYRSDSRTESSESSAQFSRPRSVTDSYQLSTSRLDPFEKKISYPPVARPVPEYRKPSYPPMARPITSDNYRRSSAPPPQNGEEGAESGQKSTSTFPVPTISNIDRMVSANKGKGEPSEAGDRISSTDNRKARLLIVDDETQLLTMFKRVFEPQGYLVTTFSDSLDALADFRNDPSNYDLAILDQRMPEMSGSSLATQMISMRSDFPIILLTGYSDTLSPDDVARIGIRKYLSKPIPQAKLSATIRGILKDTVSR